MQLIPWVIVACWATFIIFWIVSAFNVKRDIGRSPWRRLWWIRVIIAVLVVCWIVGTSAFAKSTHQLWIVHQFWLFNMSAAGPLGVWAQALCVMGTGIAIWARVYQGRTGTGHPSLKQGARAGNLPAPYALVQHTIYTGVILATLGSTTDEPSVDDYVFCRDGHVYMAHPC